MKYGDYRSARETGNDWVATYEIAMSIDHEDERAVAVSDWWRCADMSEVAKALVWSGAEGRGSYESSYALWWIDEPEWRCALGECILASNKTLDLQPLQRKWAAIPARSVLHIWEEWAVTHAPADLYAPRNAIELCERGLCDVEEAWAAAAAATAAAAAAAAAMRAIRASWGAAAAEAAAAAIRASWGAAAAAAAAAAMRASGGAAAAEAAARAAEAAPDANTYEDWSMEWAVHVLKTVRSGK